MTYPPLFRPYIILHRYLLRDEYLLSLCRDERLRSRRNRQMPPLAQSIVELHFTPLKSPDFSVNGGSEQENALTRPTTRGPSHSTPRASDTSPSGSAEPFAYPPYVTPTRQGFETLWCFPRLEELRFGSEDPPEIYAPHPHRYAENLLL